MGGAFGSGEHPPELEVDIEDQNGGVTEAKGGMRDKGTAAARQEDAPSVPTSEVDPPKGGLDEFEWIWKVRDEDSAYFVHGLL